MKVQIRKNVFETNSSSTHALNIFRGNFENYEIPKKVVIRPNEFGWEYETYDYPEDKLSYLYTWILSICKTWEYNEVTEKYEYHYDYKKLKDYQYRIKSKLQEAGVEEVEFEKCNGYYDDGYIDHSEDLFEEDLDTIIETYFNDFVFNNASYVETGNDNGYDSRVCEDGSADWSMFKGN
jgi:hypothetical protein